MTKEEILNTYGSQIETFFKEIPEVKNIEELATYWQRVFGVIGYEECKRHFRIS